MIDDALENFGEVYSLAEKHPELMPYVQRAFTSAYAAASARKEMFHKVAEILDFVEAEARRLRDGEGGGA
jgi:hypothetical protein